MASSVEYVPSQCSLFVSTTLYILNTNTARSRPKLDKLVVKIVEIKSLTYMRFCPC